MTETFPLPSLAALGLNLQAVFNLSDLSRDLISKLEDAAGPVSRYKQLILIGHGGTKLWQRLQSDGFSSDNPIDDFSVHQITKALRESLAEPNLEFVYPGTSFTGLQGLGALAGWHSPTPLRIGINDTWGTWYAYRALVLANSGFEATQTRPITSPCESCETKPCITACPAGAVTGDDFAAKTCFAWRAEESSSCQDKCLARLACPIARDHRYSDEQMAYHYGLSLRSIKRMSGD